MSIRYKLLLIFGLLIAFSGGLTAYVLRAVFNTSELVVSTYDGPLMGVNYARSAHSKLTKASTMMRRSIALRDLSSGQAAEDIERLVDDAKADLKVVRERVREPSVLSSLDRVEEGLRIWKSAGLSILKSQTGGVTEITMPSEIARLGELVLTALDDLVEQTAAYGFDIREKAQSSAQALRTRLIALSAVVGIFTLLSACAFAYSLARPIREAVSIAGRVASGVFTDEIAVHRRDELGHLLRSLSAMQSSLKLREERADAASRAKSQFLATMSHEIRTPMNAVLGLTDALLATKLEPDQHRSLLAIHEAGENLLGILNDILDLSKLEAGKFQLDSAPFSPRSLGHTMISVLSPRAVDKGLSLEIEDSSELPQAVMGDVGRIRQVLLNLVSNAIKFTDVGRVVVATRCARIDAETALLTWEVRDTGIGMDF